MALLEPSLSLGENTRAPHLEGEGYACRKYQESTQELPAAEKIGDESYN
jgi:hypothetical protein